MADDAARHEQEIMESMDAPTYEDFREEILVREENRVYFPSNDNYIVDGLNGRVLNCKPGSFDMLRYFKMTDTSGRADQHGIIYANKTEPANRRSNVVYYDSPEAYERGQDTILSQDYKTEWYNVRNKIFGNDIKYGSFNREEYDNFRNDVLKRREQEIIQKQEISENERLNKLEAKKNKKLKENAAKEIRDWAYEENRKINKVIRNAEKILEKKEKNKKHLEKNRLRKIEDEKKKERVAIIKENKRARRKLKQEKRMAAKNN